MPKATDIINLAISQLGVSEPHDPYNAWYYGHSVDDKQYAWCSVYVSWLYWKLGAESLIGRRSAYSGDLLAWGQQHGEEVPLAHVLPGDIVVFKWNAAHTITDHIGIVESHTQGSTTVHTIEGNTSDAVRRRDRTESSTCLMWFVRPKYSSTAPAPPAPKPKEDDEMLYGYDKPPTNLFSIEDCWRDRYNYGICTDGTTNNLTFKLSGHLGGEATTDPQSVSGMHDHNLQDILKQDRMKVIKGSFKLTVTCDTPVGIYLRESLK